MHHYRAAAAVLLCAILAIAGCRIETTPVQAPVAEATAAARETVQEQVVPAVVELRETVQEILPEPPPPAEPIPDLADALATALIVRWEVTSKAYYTRRLQGVICPGGASGPTWGLGWDGGHQTERDNREAWVAHEHVDRLALTSGQVGEARCRASRAGLTDIRVPYPLAEAVFIRFGLPKYKALAVRKYGIILLDQAAGVRGALYSETYNRGGSIRGSRGIEQLHIRDVCLPAYDNECTAVQLEKMCRLWQGTPIGAGLCGRRFDEAKVARTGMHGV